MKTFLKTFLADESGASAAEYALILVVIGVAIITGGLALGDAIGSAMSKAGECILDPSTGGVVNKADCGD
ncbi:Flp family type IVb pilin [Altererythrobacter soli]|uniref:Flp family type IVb pilin n=1 Tax=Croceibacterium soli TaxID=1739690 RepID=A0A6I4URU5_9SPHN|nr:Flp family type IVb pilin [Croceibacterium soli]MXP41622.1 Flp family type IVb pilin [Croceibacterium soli]